MAITWGSYVGEVTGDKMRLGVELTFSPTEVGSATESVTITTKYYVQFQQSHSDGGSDLEVWGGAVPNGTHEIGTISSPAGVATLIKTLTQVTNTIYGESQTLGAGGDLTNINVIGASKHARVTGYVTIPARSLGPPADPTAATVTRNSDTSHTVAWTNNATSTAPYSGGLYVERWDSNTTAWTVIASALAAATTSYTDLSTIPDRVYQYRVRAKNATDFSGYATTAQIATTPNVPTGVTASRAISDITVAWADVSSIETGFEVWHAANGVWDGAALTTTAPGVTSYLHTGADSAQSHKYRLRAVALGSRLSAYSADSNTLAALVAPGPPSGMSPSGRTVDALEQILFSWVHTSLDGTAQTAYQIRYRLVGAGTWTTLAKVTSSSQFYAMPAATLANGNAYEWQVMTWGQAVAGSVWSDTATFPTAARPVVTITIPDGEGHTSDTLRPEWIFYSANGRAQASYKVSLYSQAGALLEQIEATHPDVRMVELATTLANDTTYELRIRVTDEDGQVSDVETRTFLVDYIDPAPPQVELTWDPDRGSVLISITNPTGTVSDAAPLYNNVYRQEGEGWLLIRGQVPLDSSVQDAVPPLGGSVLYRVQVVSELETSTDVLESVACVNPGDWFYFNSGPDFSQVARCRYQPTIQTRFGRRKTLHAFAGRTRPVQFLGQQRDHVVTLSALLANDDADGDPLAFMDVIDNGHIVCYRDPVGKRMFGSVSEASFEDYVLGNVEFTRMSLSLTEVDHAE